MCTLRSTRKGGHVDLRPRAWSAGAERDAVRRVSSGGMEWYVLDTLLFGSRSSVWMRCVKTADSGGSGMSWCCRRAC